MTGSFFLGGDGGYWFHSIHPSLRLSICPSVPHPRVCPVAPTVLVGSISYLYILLSKFWRCVACKVSGKISKLEILAIFFSICNFDFVCFDLGSDVNH